MKIKQRDRKVIAFELNQHRLDEEARKADDLKAHDEFFEQIMREEFEKENRISMIEGDKYRSGEEENPLESYVKDVEVLWPLSREEYRTYAENKRILETGGNGSYLVRIEDDWDFYVGDPEDYLPSPRFASAQ